MFGIAVELLIFMLLVVAVGMAVIVVASVFRDRRKVQAKLARPENLQD